LDLLVVIGLAALLSAWLGVNCVGERARTAACRRNLAVLGAAMQGFTHDHRDTLPPAVITRPELPWDTQIAPHLPRNLVQDGIDPLFLCPSDRVSRPRPRSYAMSAHNMAAENWPPGPENETGIGLVWNKPALQRLLGTEVLSDATNSTDSLAMVKLSGVPSPADTVCLAESINAANNVKSIEGTYVSGCGNQMVGLQLEGTQPQFHLGRFNYLMVDGHVQRLRPFTVETISGSSGVWAVKKRK